MGIRRRLHVINLVAIAVAMLLSGCMGVASTRPFTANPTPADKQRFEGIWQAGNDGVLYVWFECSDTAQLAMLDSHGDGLRMGQMDMFIVPSKKEEDQGETGFLSVPEQIMNPAYYPEELKNRHFYFAQYKFITPKDLVIWMPNVDFFKETIKAGLLHGEENGEGGVTITSSPAELMAFIDNPKNLSLFDYRNPLLLRKIADGESGLLVTCRNDNAKQKALVPPQQQTPEGSTSGKH